MTIPLLPDDPHDLALRRLVKPPEWVNPTPAGRYHLVVLGGGPAGLVCAAGAAGLGARVALVERDLMGGDCLNVGCVPSKTLLHAARAAAEIRRARELGVLVAEPEIDFTAVMSRVRRVRAELAPVDSAERYRSLGVDLFLGDGRFADEGTVEVNGAKLHFGRCVIATGSQPLVPDIPGLEGARWFTNETIFSLTELPKRLLVIGGGPQGCELGQAFARLGSKVTIAAKGGFLLPQEDPIHGEVMKALLEIYGATIVDAFELPSLAGFDAILVAAGRRPNVEGLNLDAAGVKYDVTTGIAVDDYLRTTNRRVFAAGDACSVGFRFTHAADAMARLVIRNALFPSKARVSALTIPRCTYTDPEIATVGLNMQEADRRGIRFDDYHSPPNLGWPDRAATDGRGLHLMVLTKRGTDRILGATIQGPCAGELAGTLSVAMTNQIGLKALANTVFPYPTYTESIKKMADEYNRTRLTPRVMWLIAKWLRWFR